MAHHYGIDYDAIFESELILAQFADPFAGIDTDVPGCRLQIAPQYLHKGGLARAVGAYKAIAIAIAELDGNVFEQRLGPELHGNVGSGNQSLRPEKIEAKKTAYFTLFFKEFGIYLKLFH
jgi:hypothetical protein